MPHLHSSKDPKMKRCQVIFFRLGCVKVMSSACIVKGQTMSGFKMILILIKVVAVGW